MKKRGTANGKKDTVCYGQGGYITAANIGWTKPLADLKDDHNTFDWAPL